MWAALSGAVPVYWLYSLLLIDGGVSDAQLSVLLGIWSATALIAEVPSGALADRWSRRHAVALEGVAEALAFFVWAVVPTFSGFALGFALWAIGGSFASGALEALLFDGLRAHGADDLFPSALGRVRAAELWVQPPAAAAATLLFAAGGHALVLWVSVGWALMVAVVATRLPDHRIDPSHPEAHREPARVGIDDLAGPGHVRSAAESVDGPDDPDLGYVAMLRAGLAEAATLPGLRMAVVMVALIGGFDAVDEYFPVMARGWGVSTTAIPIVLAVISIAGAVAVATAGRVSSLGHRSLAVLLAVSAATLALSGATGMPIGLAALAVGYGSYRLVAVVLEVRLQERITGPARATVASVAAFGVEISALGLFAVWAIGGLAAVSILMAVVAVAVWVRR